MKERRAQGRLLDCEFVIVTWEQGSQTVKQIGNIDNLSSGGMGVLVEQPIPIGDSVTVSYDGGDGLTGIVRHHSRNSGRHLVGIEFSENSKESALHFQPEFLTCD